MLNKDEEYDATFASMVSMTPTIGVNHNKNNSEATKLCDKIRYYNKISNYNADLNPADYTMF